MPISMEATVRVLHAIMVNQGVAKDHEWSSPIKEDPQFIRMKNNISTVEEEILRLLDFEVEFTLPQSHILDFGKWIMNLQKKKEDLPADKLRLIFKDIESIKQYANIFCNDSFYLDACLQQNSPTIAAVCLRLAQRQVRNDRIRKHSEESINLINIENCIEQQAKTLRNETIHPSDQEEIIQLMREMYVKSEANKNLQIAKKQVSPQKFKEWNDMVGHEKTSYEEHSINSNATTDVTLNQ